MSIGIDCLREFLFVKKKNGGQPGHNSPTIRVPDGALGWSLAPGPPPISSPVEYMYLQHDYIDMNCL